MSNSSTNNSETNTHRFEDDGDTIIIQEANPKKRKSSDTEKFEDNPPLKKCKNFMSETAYKSYCVGLLIASHLDNTGTFEEAMKIVDDYYQKIEEHKMCKCPDRFKEQCKHRNLVDGISKYIHKRKQDDINQIANKELSNQEKHLITQIYNAMEKGIEQEIKKAPIILFKTDYGYQLNKDCLRISAKKIYWTSHSYTMNKLDQDRKLSYINVMHDYIDTRVLQVTKTICIIIWGKKANILKNSNINVPKDSDIRDNIEEYKVYLSRINYSINNILHISNSKFTRDLDRYFIICKNNIKMIIKNIEKIEMIKKNIIEKINKDDDDNILDIAQVLIQLNSPIEN